jgi:hypothetical protein
MKNEYAFPVSTIDGHTNEGLTKREYFAGLAMQGILSGVSGVEALASVHPTAWIESAVQAADALIAELEKSK